MGWKNVKNHYRIEHHVQVTNAGICIGSGYIHDIIVIGMDGVIKKGYPGVDWISKNDCLNRYTDEMNDNPEKLKELVLSPDIFDVSIPVFTYDDAEIIEKQCEELGYPNVTHDGQMMYENTFSTDRKEVVKWALENAESWVKCLTERLEMDRKKLADVEAALAESIAAVEKLKTA